jgi:RNA polymerase sigma-70 factor (ECF subfamily)
VASPTGEPIVVHGAAAVAREALAFASRAADARTAVVDGSVGLAVGRKGRLFVVLTFAVTGERITELGIVADPERLHRMHLIDHDIGQPARWLPGRPSRVE